MSLGDTRKRPDEVVLAVALFCIALGIGLGKMVSTPIIFKMPLVLSFNLITSLVSIFFIYKIYQGKNWSRIIFSLLSVVGVFIQLKNMFQFFGVIPNYNPVISIDIPFQLLGVYYIFKKSSSSWFNSVKEDQG